MFQKDSGKREQADNKGNQRSHVSPAETTFVFVVNGGKGGLDEAIFGWHALENCFLHIKGNSRK